MCSRIVLAVSLLAGTCFAAAPPARPSAAQRLLLQGRDALLEQMRQQQEKKNLALAEKLCRGALDVEVMVYGSVSMPVVGTKKILAGLSTSRVSSPATPSICPAAATCRRSTGWPGGSGRTFSVCANVSHCCNWGRWGRFSSSWKRATRASG